MREARRLKQATYVQMMSGMAPFLTDEYEETLSYLQGAQPRRSGLRFPHRCCVAHANWEAREMSKRIDLLEFQRDRLEGIVKDQASQVSTLAEKMADLLTQQRQKVRGDGTLLDYVRSVEPEEEFAKRLEDIVKERNRISLTAPTF